MMYETYKKQVEPLVGLRISEEPRWIMPPWQSMRGAVRFLEGEEAVLLCRSLRFRGAYIYYAAGAAGEKHVGAAAIIKYRMTTGVIRQEIIGSTSTCSMLNAELTGIWYALQHARNTIRKTAHIYVATTSLDAIAAIQRGQNATRGRESLQRIGDAVHDLGSVNHRVTIFLVPGNKTIRGVKEARAAAQAVMTPNGRPTLQLSERVRELSGVLRLIDKERSNKLHLSEDDVQVKYYTWKMDRAWSGKHTLRLYGALSSDEASILVQARTEHCGLNACLFRKKLADSPTCECGRGDETVRHVLLHCERWAEARKALREAAGDRWGDASYLLGGWSGRKDIKTGKLVDGPRERWKPNLEVVRASIRFLYQTGRLSRSSELRIR
jgi:ribonuclease HI